MKVRSKDGVELMDVKSIDLEGEALIIKGKMMGAIPATMELGPADIWAAFQLLSWKARFGFVVMLLKGGMASGKATTA